MQICPTCGNDEAQILIVNVQNGQRFCHQCAGTVCPTFGPGLVFTPTDVKFLKQSGIDPQTAGIEAYCKPQTETVQLVLDDLMFLRKTHIHIDEETFASALQYENMHRNFAPCSDCRVTTFGQHDPVCRHASVLWLPDWFEVVQAREADSGN